MADSNKKYLTASDDAITNKYTKPSSGIPKTDLATAVQDQLVWEKGRNATMPGVEMASCNAIGNRAVAEGAMTVAIGTGSHAEGYSTSSGFIVAYGKGAHAEGYEESTQDGIVASGNGSHAEGCCDGGAQITASGDGAHAEGYCFNDNDLIAEGTGSHAEGCCTRAEGDYSHSEGNGSYAAGESSHAEGQDTLTEGYYSHAEGFNTIAQNDAEHAQGKYNKSNKKTNGTAAQNAAGSTIHSVGIGTSINDRKNAFEIMQNGDMYVKGIGGYDGTNPSSAKTLQDELYYTPTSFGGLLIASGPLAYNNGAYMIEDDWNHDSYGSVHGKNNGSNYFNFIEMGQLFEKADFSINDGSIENLLDPLNGWRLPTQAEWASIVGTTRAGSTVNGSAGKHYALVQLTGVTHAGSSTPTGLLIFPDNKTITGKALSGMDNTAKTTGVTAAEINAYLEQGCVFIPQSGNAYDVYGAWGTGGMYLSSTENSGTLSCVLTFEGSNINPNASANKSKFYMSVRLVKPATPISKLDGIETLLATI